MSLSQTSVLKLYNTVIEDVIAGVRESFLDEGVDEQVLQELKQIWENKLISSKAVELNPDSPEPPPPQVLHKSVNVSKANSGVTKNNVQQSSTGSSSIVQQPQQLSQPQQSLTHNRGILNQQTITQTVQQVATTPVSVLERQVPIQITLPAQGDTQARVLTIHVPASAIAGNQLQQILTGPVITAAMGLPAEFATTLLQQHVNSTLQGQAGLTTVQVNQPLQVVSQSANNIAAQRTIQNQGNIAQLDGQHGDSSDDDDDEEEDDNDDDDEDLDENQEEENDDAAAREEEPLNSEDDVTDDDPTDQFETDNVVVCQYDKITRSRNKWKFFLKDGIMNLSGKDFVFQKAGGDAEW